MHLRPFCIISVSSWRQLGSAGSSAFSFNEFAQNNCRFILRSIGVFEFRFVHVLPDSFLYDPKSVGDEISFFA